MLLLHLLAMYLKFEPNTVLVSLLHTRIVKLANFGLILAYAGASIIWINDEMVISNWRLF